ncbi:27779_t:CDS:1, partial [Gigaspora margarita]
TTLGIIITLHRRLAKTHKYEGIVRANTLTRKKTYGKMNTMKYSNKTWQNGKKKQKLHDVGDNKENMFYNSFDTLNNSPILEYPHNNDSLSWDEKVEFELSTLKDTTNIWNNSTITQPSEVTETTQEPPKSTNNSELMLDMALQLDQIEEQDTTRGSLEINNQVTNSHREE